MKKILFLAATAVACTLGITGCSNEIEEPATSVTGKQVTMTLQASTTKPSTRADYTQEGNVMKFSWRSADEISVVVNGEAANANCQLTTTEAAKAASFSGTVTAWTGTKDIYVFYPYAPAGYTVTNGDTPNDATIAYTLPQPQTYNASTHAATNGLMVGTGKAIANGTSIAAAADVKQVMSFIKFNITNAPAKVKSVTLTCDKAFDTQATVKLSDATLTDRTMTLNELYMNVTYNEGTTTKEASTTEEVSFALFPADLTGKTIKARVTFEDGKSKGIVITGTNFERNKHYAIEFDATGAATLPTMQYTIDLNKSGAEYFTPFKSSFIKTGDYTLTVDWGDGTTTTIAPKTWIKDIPSHTYTRLREYTITITSTQEDFTQEQIPGFKLRIEEAYISFITPILNTRMTDFSSCFSKCINLTKIPADLFKYNTEVTNFSHCFYLCNNLTEIPAELFASNAAVTDFSSCFQYCNNITEIPADLFKYNTAVTNFSSCFYRCTNNLTAVPEGLFSQNEKVTTFKECFYECGNLTTIPKGLFDSNTAVTTFEQCFYDCRKLAAIPEGLFSSNTAVTTFNECFYFCNSLTAIPTGLFDSNTAVTTFASCFDECASLKDIPENLFSNNTAVTTFEKCFRRCGKLILNSNIFCNQATEKETRFANVPSIIFSLCFYEASKNFCNGYGYAPELWTYKFMEGAATTTDCFSYISRVFVLNGEDIPAEWGGNKY